MLSKKSSIVPWNIAIDKQICQNFYLSYVNCPGWKIKTIGTEKVSCTNYLAYRYIAIIVITDSYQIYVHVSVMSKAHVAVFGLIIFLDKSNRFGFPYIFKYS